MDLKTALDDLQAQDYFIWDDFLSTPEVARVAADFHQIYDGGSFEVAGTGNQEGVRNLHQRIRSDETYWLNATDLTLPQTIFWDRLETLKKEINEQLFLGLWSFDGHYSRYPIHGHYQKHLDRFKNDDQRTISMVLYLNPEWMQGDGGELRFHTPKAALKTLDVQPLGGRLVCFLSAEVLHEVLVTQQLRLSFAGWWSRR